MTAFALIYERPHSNSFSQIASLILAACSVD